MNPAQTKLLVERDQRHAELKERFMALPAATVNRLFQLLTVSAPQYWADPMYSWVWWMAWCQMVEFMQERWAKDAGSEESQGFDGGAPEEGP